MDVPLSAPQVGDTVGRYRLDRVLGAGGMGVVYAATDARLDRAVAVKVMSLAGSADSRARFAREVTTLARLESPHVIGIHDHGEHPPDGGGAPYLVTRLVPGGDLGALLRARGPLPPRLAAAVVAQVAEALRDAHAAGVVHRDVKPANVLLRDPDAPEPFAYLCDFGIATLDGSSLTRTGGGVSGTWSYLAPERIDGGPGTPASDLYALGCLLWTTLTGRPPYTGSEYAVAQAHRGAPVPQLPGADPLTAELNRFLATAMAKDPRDRFPDAESARRALEHLARGAAPSAPPGPSGHPVPVVAPHASGRRGRRTALLASAAALVLLAGAAVTGVVLWDRDGGPDPAPVAESEGPVDDPADGAAGVTGDVDGDGLGDVVVQVGKTKDTELLTFTSDGSSLAAPDVAPGRPGASLLGDVDGDGRADVVTPGGGPDDDLLIRVALAGGDEERISVPARPTGQKASSVPSLVDLDGDGVLELALYDNLDPDDLTLRTTVLAGQDTARPTEIDLPALAPGILTSGDFDGDGADELLNVADDRLTEGAAAGQELALDGGTFVARVGPSSFGDAGPVLMLRADTDGDGAEEVVRFDLDVEDGSRGLQTFDRADDGAWTGLEAVRETDLPGDLVYYPSVTDLDGDGDDDVVLLRQENGAMRLDAYLADAGTLTADGTWATWDCGERCGRKISAVGPSG